MGAISSYLLSCFLVQPTLVQDADVQQRLSSRPAQNRILPVQELTIEKICRTETGKRLYAEFIRKADDILKKPTAERIMLSFRINTIRTTQTNCIVPALAYRLTGNPVYADRAEKEMLAACRFSDWNPKHFLDTATIALGVATAYDWTRDRLTPEKAELIEKALIEKAIKPALLNRYWWQAGSNNWVQVCYTGLTAAALVTANREPELAARIIANAVNAQVNVMRESYAPNGVYPEGIGYWKYGTSDAVLLISMLEHAFHTDFGLGKQEGWDKTGDFVIACFAPSGRVYNYGDNGEDFQLDHTLLYFAKKFNRPDYIRPGMLKTLHGGRAFNFFWLPEDDVRESCEWPLFCWSGETSHNHVAFLRTSWKPDACYLGIKGGSPHYNHAHMDSGSFIFETDGIRWVVDPNPEGYAKMELAGIQLWNMNQESTRWTVLRDGPELHSILRIDNHQQRVNGCGKMHIIQTKAPLPEIEIDLTSLYPDAKSVIRNARLTEQGLIISDTIRGLDAGKTVKFQFLTEADAETAEDGSLLLKQGGRVMTVKTTPAVQWKMEDAKQFVRDIETQFTRKTTRLSFELHPDPDGCISSTVKWIR